MRVKEIDVPRGCRKICIDVEDGNIVISYESGINSDEFYCEETGEVESRPSVGSFAIFWNKDARGKAIVANLESGIKFRPLYMASDKNVYEAAIKFRDYKQYLKVRGYDVEQL